ncbi:MAG: metal-dependent transcriptional regulator [Desulfomonilaceae bacterium]|nr:metal-dependent transcriptional regulator [Desulfomonilaceae bacterium]
MSSSNSVPELTSAMEDYLEAIYHLEQERRIARVRDIAKRLDVRMSSVSSALRSLGARGFIEYDPHQFITLTERGIQKAKEIVRKHEVLKRFLVRVLQVEESAAEDNACRLEHHLAPEVIDKLVNFVEFVEMCPVDQTRWLSGLSEGCDDCIHCLEQAAKQVRTRERVQQAALEDGLTLAEAPAGSQVMIETVRGTAKLRKMFADKGLESGVIVEIEAGDKGTGTLQVNIKGYHVSLDMKTASKILVKPI